MRSPQAAQQAGIPATDDFNRGDNEGVGYFEVNQKAGWRWNASKAFLRPVQHRPNLTVWTQTQVERLCSNAMRRGRCAAPAPTWWPWPARARGGHARGGAQRRQHRFGAGPAALGHRAGGGAAGGGHDAGARAARRGREPAGPPADPLGLQGAGRENAQHPGQLALGQGGHRAAVRADAQRADEHVAQPARRVHPQRPVAAARQHRIPRAAALASTPSASRCTASRPSPPASATSTPAAAAMCASSRRDPRMHRPSRPTTSHRGRPPGGGRQPARDAAHRGAAGDGEVPTRGVQARRAVPERRGTGAPGRRHRQHHLPPGGHHEDGPRRRPDGGGRQPPARARRGRAARGRCGRDAHHHQRQHQQPDA
jgi:hypothetical protein